MNNKKGRMKVGKANMKGWTTREILLLAFGLVFLIAFVITLSLVHIGEINDKTKIQVPKYVGVYTPLQENNPYTVVVLDSRMYKHKELISAIQTSFNQINAEYLQKIGVKQ